MNLFFYQTRNARWNIEGIDFHSMRLFFEPQYEQPDEIIDSFAERIRTIGHYPPATLKSFLQLTHLTEYAENKNNSMRDDLTVSESVLTEADLKKFGVR